LRREKIKIYKCKECNYLFEDWQSENYECPECKSKNTEWVDTLEDEQDDRWFI
jgi:rubrerythrin